MIRLYLNMKILTPILVCLTVDFLEAKKDCVHVSVNTGNDNENEYDEKSDIIAFHALMTKRIDPEKQQTLIFDEVKTNQGNAYNKNTGEFTAPKSGLYVFIYAMRMHKAEHSTELMINNTVYGATFLRAKNGDDDHVSGTVVAYVSKGEKVYLRNHSVYKGDGYYNSNNHGQSTFSGWLLH